MQAGITERKKDVERWDGGVLVMWFATMVTIWDTSVRNVPRPPRNNGNQGEHPSSIKERGAMVCSFGCRDGFLVWDCPMVTAWVEGKPIQATLNT